MVGPEDDPRLRALLRLGREVSARHDLDDVLSETFRELRVLVDFSGGSIQLIDDEGWITVAAADPPVSADSSPVRVPLGSSAAARVVLTEQAIYVPDVAVDGRDVLLPSPEWAARIGCYLAVPLLADGRAIGVLRVDHHRPGAFSDHDRQLVVTAAVIVAAAIQNARAAARSLAARSRVDNLERRIDRARAHLAEAASLPDVPAQVSDLLRRIDADLGEPPVGLQLPIETQTGR